MIPSGTSEGRSFLDEIHEKAEKRLAANGKDVTCFVTGKDGSFKHLPTKTLNLSLRDRFSLIRLLVKNGTDLQGKQIREFFRDNFFESTLWEIWSIQ
jgi:oleate hydratase